MRSKQSCEWHSASRFQSQSRQKPADPNSVKTHFEFPVAVTGLARLIAVMAVLVVTAVPSSASADPQLALGPSFTLEGSPLQLELTSDSPATIDIRFDGALVASREIETGLNSIEIEDTRVGVGRHTVEISAGEAVTIAGSFTTLPGWTSVLPPLLAIALALLTRDVLISLFFGIFGGAMLANGGNPLIAFARAIDQYIVSSLADRDHASLIVFTCLLGAMVGLISKNGGTHGIIARLRPFATTPRRGQLATWAMGVLIFFDDYANTLIVGPTMRPITDQLRISREKLAYIVDSTAAPVVCLFPISTWVGFEIGLVGQALDSIGLDIDAYSAFVGSIPYRFYPIFALVLGFSIAASRVDFGPMRKAERRARATGLLLAEDAKPIADYDSTEMEPASDVPKRARNALLPILTVITVTLIGLAVSGLQGLVRADTEGTLDWIRRIFSNADSFQALLWSSLSGVMVALLLGLGQRLLSLREAMGALMGGVKAMMMALIVLVLAWSLGSVCADLHTADYLVRVTEGALAPNWLPALTFVLSAAIAFATGSSWGTLSILEPLIIPICHNLTLGAGIEAGSDLYFSLLLGTIASVMAGSVWGDHCSPISDTTILSSMASGCDHIAHVRTQIPYAFFAGGLGITFGNIGTGFGLSPWISLVAGVVVIVTTLRILAARTS